MHLCNNHKLRAKNTKKKQVGDALYERGPNNNEGFEHDFRKNVLYC